MAKMKHNNTPFNPYKQPVVTLKQWRKERWSKQIKKAHTAQDRINLVNLKIENGIQRLRDRIAQANNTIINTLKVNAG